MKTTKLSTASETEVFSKCTHTEKLRALHGLHAII
jgi:hypothetical protein